MLFHTEKAAGASYEAPAALPLSKVYYFRHNHCRL